MTLVTYSESLHRIGNKDSIMNYLKTFLAILAALLLAGIALAEDQMVRVGLIQMNARP